MQEQQTGIGENLPPAVKLCPWLYQPEQSAFHVLLTPIIYGSLLYSSSVTGSSHSFAAFSPGTSTAR